MPFLDKLEVRILLINIQKIGRTNGSNIQRFKLLISPDFKRQKSRGSFVSPQNPNQSPKLPMNRHSITVKSPLRCPPRSRGA